MSNQKVVCVNEVTIRFEQLENENSVNWHIIPDDKVEMTRDMSLMDLAECGAPLSALGIRELWKLCNDGLVYTALETANATRNGVLQRSVTNRANPELKEDHESTVIH